MAIVMPTLSGGVLGGSGALGGSDEAPSAASGASPGDERRLVGWRLAVAVEVEGRLAATASADGLWMVTVWQHADCRAWSARAEVGRLPRSKDGFRPNEGRRLSRRPATVCHGMYRYVTARVALQLVLRWRRGRACER